MKNRGLLLLPALCMVLIMPACGKEQKETEIVLAPEEEGISYVTIQPTYEDILAEENLDCTYRQSVIYELSFGLDDYFIESVDVKKGDLVQEGQLLASLDVSDIEKQMPDLEYALQKSQLLLKQAVEERDYELESAYILYSYGKMEKQDKENLKEEQENIEKIYRDRIQDLEDQVTVDTARLQQGKEQLEKGLIYAPASGEVTFAATTEKGKYSKATENIVTVSALSGCYFASYNLEYKDYFKEGDIYQIKCAEYGDYSYYDITPVNMEKWEEEECLQFALVGETEQVDLGVRGTLTLSLGEKNNVLCIPKKAVHETENGYFVYLLEDGIRKMQDVKIGMTGNDKQEIISGITEEDIVIVDQMFSENIETTQKEGAANEE